MKQIKLSKGYFATVDDEDYERVSAHKWHVHVFKNNIYASRWDRSGVKKREQLMHRFIMGEDNPLIIDHKDRDSLNNQKSNLRFCTRAENSRNKTSQYNSTSKYIGVSKSIDKTLYKIYYKWKAQININGKRKNLGRFKDEKEAALAYNNAAKVVYGDFANLNTIL